MDIGWNFRREHLRLQQRSHMSHHPMEEIAAERRAADCQTVWSCHRETDYQHIKDLWETGNKIAQAAAAMAHEDAAWRLLSAAWPQHMNKPVAEATQANIKRVGLPAWDDKDQALAKATQRLVKAPERGLANRNPGTGRAHPAEQNIDTMPTFASVPG